MQYEDFSDYVYSTYTGAPDECNLHWPTKLDSLGNCPDCNPKSEEKK